MAQEQLQNLQDQINVLKIRTFDAEERVKEQTRAIQEFLDAVAQVMQKDEVTLQVVYDFIKDQYKEPVDSNLDGESAEEQLLVEQESNNE